ncbi:MAG: phosphoribosylformylglycinamidine synthase I [Deltaproteobacteria bacterium]|nr:phosphoribosylformylglycinamidine synthase I [Deltaproteobacteria bacterium]
MKVGIVVFPGTNCDKDIFWSIKTLGGIPVYIWHEQEDVGDIDCIILPGGFSYGDYLRAGGLAKFSKIMDRIGLFADEGKFVIGICNGFQILCESGLLPGVLMRNSNMRFICRDIFVKVEKSECVFTKNIEGKILKMPIAHKEGNFWCSNETYETLGKNGQIVFRYSTLDGEIKDAANPNGSLHNIAGVCNIRGNVLGMMPHPERACEELLGGVDGRQVLNFVGRENG